jgi:hypothetical protein
MTVPVKSRCWRLRDCLTAMPLTLICSLVVVFLDVVLDGSYIFSAVICPIGFVVGLAWNIVRRPNLGLAAARLLIPLVTGVFVVTNYSVQSRIAMHNAERLIQACERYREANGNYPEQLGDLVPRYVNSVPRAKYCCSASEFMYRGQPRHTLSWWECPPFGRRVYNLETGKWRYVD